MLARFLIVLLRVYQWTLSPLIGQVCRFQPSCSNYAIDVLRYHGALRGSWLVICRLARCHPFHPGGYDPAPLPRSKSTSDSARDAPNPSSPPPDSRLLASMAAETPVVSLRQLSR